MTANEDFLFAQEALSQGFVTDAQVKEALLLQKRMAEELKIDERVGVILVKRGWLADDQARRVQARIAPQKGEPGEIHGYRLLEIVGRGAMGTVYRAIHTGLNRTVAIKILRQDLAGDRTQIERLKAEATTLASLDHPNIVRALDAGESNGFPYFVMEFVEGETLRDRMRREGPLPESVALQITRGLADALERARRMGVVHRDVKPGNVLLTRTGIPKLMDLGLAKGPIDLGLTQHGSTVGTPQYIAPEQAVDPRSADTRSDIYALGATLYAMLTGQPPFDGQTLAEILTKVLYETPVPLRQLRPEISAETGYLVERMMLRDPSLRYHTPALVVEDIDKLTGGNSILPKGFAGNWEAYLLKRRWRRISIIVPSTVAVALAVAFGVRWIVTRSEGVERRAQVERALGRIPAFPPRSASHADIEAVLANIRVLLAEAGRSDSAKAEDLRAIETNYATELKRVVDVDAGASKATALESGGRFRAADEELHLTRRRVRNDGPASRALDERTALVRSRSDAALLASRRAAFAANPRDIEELLASLEAWLRRLEQDFAPTVLRSGQATIAQTGVDGARELASVMTDGLRTLTNERQSERIAAGKLAEARADLASVRARIERTRANGAEEHLVRGEARFVGAVALDTMLREPIDGCVRALEAAVTDAWRVAKVDARSMDAAGDTDGARGIYASWAEAAADGEAFVDIAADARAARDVLDFQTRSASERATTAVNDLAAGISLDLQRQRIDSVVDRLRAARARASVFAPRSSELEWFERIPAAWDRLYARAIQAFAARQGDAEERWIKSLAFVTGEREKLLEVRAVDEGSRTVTFVSHAGNYVHNAQTRSVADVAVEDLVQMAGLSAESPDDALTLAVHAFRGLDIDQEARPYEAAAALTVVADLLDRAGSVESPLASHVKGRLIALENDNKRLEKNASDTYRNAEDWFAQGRYDGADGDYRDLLLGRFAPSKFVQARIGEIADKRERIKGEKNRSVTQLALNGARVERTGSAGLDGRDVRVTITFDTPEQLRNFSSGWARMRNPGHKTDVTPEIDARDQGLLLLPDSPGEIVRGRPLVMPTFLDPSVEMAMSFLLWPTAPFFLALDLDGAQVGVLSADPQEIAFPPDVPRLDGEKDPPKFDHYGRGLGVRFHLGADFGDPAVRWGWTAENQGRRFLPPISKRTNELLATKWFSFKARDPNRQLPYRVRFVRTPGRSVRLEVDGTTIAEDAGEAFKAIRPSGRIQILTYTSCLIDDLELTGRVSSAWLERMNALLYPTKSDGSKERK